MTVTFQDIERKYNKTVDHLDYIHAAASDENTNPKHATWLHHPTLARWLFGSSKEFVEEFESTSELYKNRNAEEEREIGIWKLKLHQRIDFFRAILRFTFPDNIPSSEVYP